MTLKTSILLVVVAVLLFSCDKKRIFDEYKPVGNTWHKDSVMTFDLPKIDTTKSYNLYVNLRDNDNYPFNNLFLIVSLDQPDGRTRVDTLEYQMTTPDGKLLGNGFSDIKESKLFYKQNVKFKNGDYKVHIKQAVRETGKVKGVEALKGVTEVGFRIESTE